MCRCVGSSEPGALSPEHAKLMTNFAKAIVRRLQALKFVQLEAVSYSCCSASLRRCCCLGIHAISAALGLT